MMVKKKWDKRIISIKFKNFIAISFFEYIYFYRQSANDQGALRVLGGLNSLCRILHILDNPSPDLPPVIPIK